MSGVNDPTKTAPWSSDSQKLIQKSVSHIVRCSLLMIGGATGNVLRTNLVINPNLELDADGWIATTGTFTRDTASPIAGTASAKVTAAAATAIGFQYLPTAYADRPAVVAGVPITISIRTKCSVSVALRLDYSFFDSVGNAVGGIVTGTGSLVATPAANTRITLSGTVTPPAGAAQIRLLPRTVPNMVAGNAMWVDEVHVGVGPFFDGDSPDTATERYEWAGTPGHSQSIASQIIDEVVPLDLLESGNVVWDEGRVPRVQASITCKIPPDQALLDRIDPRTGVRLLIEAGYRRAGGVEDVQPLCDLGLRTRDVTRPDDTMTLTAWSDEAILLDGAPTKGGSVTSSTTVDAILTVMNQVIGGVGVVVGVPNGPAVTATLYEDRWDVINDLADRIGAQVYDNGLRTWYINATPEVVTPPALCLTVGANGTIITSDTGLTRDEGWCNFVWLHYEWDDAGTTKKMDGLRKITSGPYAVVAGSNMRILKFDREVAATQAEANSAAASLVKRTVTRGRSFTVEAVSAYWLRPADSVEVQLPLGGPETHIVTKVDFDLKAGAMQVTTRLPDGDYTIGA